MKNEITIYWNRSQHEILGQLESSSFGLSVKEANARINRFGLNILKTKKKTDSLTLFLSQFKSPIILILMFAAILSFFLHDPIDAIIILSIVMISGILSFWQERGASQAVSKLLAMVQTKITVVRDNKEHEIPTEQVVPGDIILLTAGSIVPGDCLILASKDLFIDEAALTGETFPVEKTEGVIAEDTPLAKRSNCLFMGTHVVSGSAKAVVVFTGLNTEFGKISKELKLRPPETDFEHGILRFGYFLLEITLMLVFIIFAFNVN